MDSSAAVIVLCFGGGRCEFDFVSAEFQEIDHAGWGGGPLSFYVMMLRSCARKVVGCERFGEGSPMFLVVLCDDVVRELFERVVL